MTMAKARSEGRTCDESGLIQAKEVINLERIPLYLHCLERNDKGMASEITITHPESKESLLTLETLLSGFFSCREWLMASPGPKREEEAVNIISLDHSTRPWQEKDLSGLTGRIDFRSSGTDVARSVLKEYKRIVIDDRSTLCGLGKETGHYAAMVKATTLQARSALSLEAYPEQTIALRPDAIDSSPLLKNEASRIIIGNEDIAGYLSIENHLLACYDPVLGTNPALITPHSSSRPRVILLEGAPGTGKTELIKHANDGFFSLASLRGVEAQVSLFDNSFWNKYLGESTGNFRRMLDSPIERGCLARYVLDDVESIIPKRDSDTGGEAGRRIIKELLSFLDDSSGRYHGQFDVIISTNYRNMIDPAIISRVTHEYQVLGPRNKDHYHSALFHGHLLDWENHITMDEDSREEIAGLCEEFGFTGRDLHAISERVIDHIRNPSAYDHSLYSKRGAEFSQELLSRYRPAGIDELRDAVNSRGMEMMKGRLLERQRRVSEETERLESRIEAVKYLGLSRLEGSDACGRAGEQDEKAYHLFQEMR